MQALELCNKKKKETAYWTLSENLPEIDFNKQSKQNGRQIESEGQTNI